MLWMISLLVLQVVPFTIVVAAENAACASSRDQVKVTFYGWPDNDPPGPGIKCDIEYRSDCAAGNGCAPQSLPQRVLSSSSTSDGYSNNGTTITAKKCGPRGERAGGDGTFASPLSMASSGNWFCWQEVVYMPFLRKYVRYEDYCQQCIDDATKANSTVKVPHIDIWTGSNTGGGGKLQMRCEETLTPDGTVEMVRNPGPDMPVDFTDLYLRNGTGRGFCNGTLILGDTGSDAPPKKGIATSQSIDLVDWTVLLAFAFHIIHGIL